MNACTVYVKVFTVDLILLFLRVHAPTVKLQTAKISVSNPHTSTSSITGDQYVAIHVEASNDVISSMH